MLQHRAIEDRFWNIVKDSDSTYTSSNWHNMLLVPILRTYYRCCEIGEDFITDDDVKDKFVTGVDQRNGLWDASATNDEHIPTTDAVVERHDTWYSDNH